MNDAALQGSDRKLVLVVDSDVGTRTQLSSALVREGYSVIEAKDGRLALAMFKNHKPDVVIADVELPHIDGLTLLKQIRKCSRIPFLLMTGFAGVMDAQEAHDRGATDFLTKPLNCEEVLAALDVALNSDDMDDENAVSASEELDLDFDYCRLSIDEFVSGKISLADIFVRLSAKKYIQVEKNRVQADRDQIATYALAQTYG